MSQLSFASFFDQAKEAAPATPVKPALPAVNARPIPHRMMTIEESRRQFVSVFMDTARNLRRWEVFSDFITLAASELDMARIRTPENIEHSREICAKYGESDISNLHTLFCLWSARWRRNFTTFSVRSSWSLSWATTATGSISRRITSSHCWRGC